MMRFMAGIGRNVRLVALAGALVLGALALPGAAQAGVYTVAQCHSELNPTPGQAAFEQSPGSPFVASADCAGTAGLRIEHALPAGTAASGDYGAWVWRSPAGTVFTRIQAEARLIDEPGVYDARLWAVRTNGQQLAFGNDGAFFQAYDQSGEFVQFHSMLRCTAGSGCDPAILNPAEADVRDVLLRTEDRAAPVTTINGGSIFASQAIRGERTVGFEVADQGGGVREVELQVNGEPVFADDLGCQLNQDFATALQPCAAQASRTVSMPTSAGPFRTGENEITACGADLALDGIPNRDCKEREVFVDDICPTSAVGAGSNLTASFRKGKARIKVTSNQRPRLKGRLTTGGPYSEGGSAGVGGATICAITRVQLGGEPYVVAKTATTRDNGKYRMRLPAGANRNVYVHRVFGEEILARHGLRILSKVKPTFEIKPRGDRITEGQRLRFKGELPGPGCDSRVVKVQAKIGKRRWQVFRGVRTNDDCRYRTRFKLRATNRPTRFLFRVRVPEQNQYPYEAGVSTVRVREAGPG